MEIKDEDHLMLWEFRDVFPDDVPILPPKIDLNLSIDLLPGVVTTSRVPYNMSTLELLEMKMQLKEMLGNGYMRPSVSPWGELMLFIKKKYVTLR